MIDRLPFGPSPAPAPTPWTPSQPKAPAAPRRWLSALPWVLALALAGVVAAHHWPSPAAPPGPAPAPAPVSPPSALAVTFSAHWRAEPDRLDSVGDRVLTGELATAEAIGQALVGGAKPMADAMKAAVREHCDEAGKVMDAAALAHDMKAAAKFARGAK